MSERRLHPKALEPTNHDQERGLAEADGPGFTTTASNVASPPSHCLPHPRNNLPQYRRRRREIQPREPRIIRTKGLAKIQPNLGLI
jgi:hypothetical protein